MNASISYSDFDIVSFDNTETGAHFIWAGELYQKVATVVTDHDSSVAKNVNVIRPRDGEFFLFFGEEQIVPVDINIEVLRRQN